MNNNFRNTLCTLSCALLILVGSHTKAQKVQPQTRTVLRQVEELQMRSKLDTAIKVLKASVRDITAPSDLAYIYAYQSSCYASLDSLLIAKQMADLSMRNAKKANNKSALAVAYRASAFLNSMMNLPDDVIRDARAGLQCVEGINDDLVTKYHLNYLLYGAHSRWEDGAKMEQYIRRARYYALRANNLNLQANVNNGISSMYLARHQRKPNQQMLDSSLYYLNNAFSLQQLHPDKVSANTFVITCINLANYYLEYSSGALKVRQRKAFEYLTYAEEKLSSNQASSEKWINVLGIRSGFAIKEGDLELAERLLVQGLDKLKDSQGHFYKLEYTVNKELADLAEKRGIFKNALAYQQRADELLKKMFNEQQLFNAQKLEVKYETAKKSHELMVLKQREAFVRKQNYLFAGLVAALLFGIVSIFFSYRFKLRYAAEREKKLVQDHEDARQQAKLQLQLEKEAQGRLKAEQELLDLKKRQLEKEALANSLIINQKNLTLKEILDKIRSGDAKQAQKLIKEDLSIEADFEAVKLQVQSLHPDFFSRLHEKATQRLTTLDLKYCTYIHLKMNTKQIAKALHIEPQSVRTFKYRLKQKFGLNKDEDLENFLSE